MNSISSTSIVLPPPVWVATQKELETLAELLNRQTRVAVDTESNSLHAYREQVCLVQFSTLRTDYLVDPLSINDLSPLEPVFSNPGLEKVFHAAEYDLICLKRDFNFSVLNMFDTRWAVRLLGYAGDGLDSLLAGKFSIQVNKKFQKADWAERPLSEQQIHYARLDTHYLLPLRDMLATELEEKGLLQLALEDFERACKVEIPAGRATLWERMGNNHSFSPRELTILKELYECRENIARGLNRPTFKVMGDQQLFEIARLTPMHIDELLGLGLSHVQVTRWGKEILAAVQKGLAAPIVRLPRAHRPDEAYISRLESLKRWRKTAAQKMGVESDVILPRPLMESLAKAGPQDMLRLGSILAGSPWRLAHFGPQILNAIKG